MTGETRPSDSSHGGGIAYKEIAVGGGQVYFTRSDYGATALVDGALPYEIRSVPVVGGDVTVVARTLSPPALATDESHLYFAAESASENLIGEGVFRVSHSGGEPFKLATGAPIGLSLSATHVYFTDGDSVRRISK